jgi:hypothetical protein
LTREQKLKLSRIIEKSNIVLIDDKLAEEAIDLTYQALKNLIKILYGKDTTNKGRGKR